MEALRSAEAMEAVRVCRQAVLSVAVLSGWMQRFEKERLEKDT